MKNTLYSLVFLSIVFCMSSCAPDQKNTVRKEKIGKLETVKADVEKFHFEVSGKQIEEGKIPYGSSVVLILEGIEGFKETNGKINCDASIEVLNAKNESLVKLDSLFDKKYGNGMPVEKFTGLVELSLKCQRPLRINESYKLVFTLKDKASEAKLVMSETFVMSPTSGLTYTESGLTSDGFFFHLNSGVAALTENTVDKGDTLYAYCSNLSGLESEKGMVRADAAITLYNTDGDTLANFTDLYKEYEKDGMPAETVSELISLQLTMPTTLKSKTPYHVVFIIGDKMGKGTLTARYNFVTK